MESAFQPAYLEAQIGGQVQHYAVPPGGILRIGRNKSFEVVLDDDVASRNHAMLQQAGDGCFYVTDLGSSNGTFVNGARISAPAILHTSDRLGIGNHEFTFHQPPVVNPVAPDKPEAMPATNVVFSQSLITVLVADIRDFSGLSQRIDAGTLSRLTGTLFHETGQALQARGATTQKYIGDAVMAVWVHQCPDQELCDIISILEGLHELAGIAASLQARFNLEEPVRFGAGLNTGWASLGNVGSIAYADYTALGETVNRAFRLESSTREIARDIAIGRGAYVQLARAGNMDVYFSPATVHLKGYHEPETVYAADLGSLPSLLDVLRVTVGPSVSR
jgi:adenylate cyclase